LQNTLQEEDELQEASGKCILLYGFTSFFAFSFLLLILVIYYLQYPGPVNDIEHAAALLSVGDVR